MGGGGGGGSVGALLGLLLIVANLPCHVLIQRDHAKWGSDVAIKAHRISMRSMTAVGGCPARGSSIGEQGSLQRGDSDGDEEADVSHARLGHASCDDLVPFAGCGGQGGSSAGGNLGMVVGRLRGGASREEVERKMREEREREAQLQEELRERQLKRKQEKEYAESMQMEIRKAEEQGQMVQRSKRRMPEVLTLENLREYALGLLTDGDIDQAEEALHRVLQVDPEDVLSLFTLGELMHGTRADYIAAQSFYEQAIEADPTYLPALKRLAWLNTQRRFDVNEYGAFDDELLRKRDDQAEECYNKAVKAAPNDPEVLCAFGSFKCHIKSDKDEAQELFSRAVQLNPNSLEAHTCYALFLERSNKDMVGAQLLFKRAAQLAPNDMQALWNLAKFFHRSRHEPGTAEKIYRRMLQNDPCDEVVLSALEELLHEENRLREAEELYDDALRVEPDNSAILCGLSKLLIDKGDLEGAKTAAKKAFSADPRNAASLCILGKLSAQGAFVDQADEKFMDPERLFRAALFADPQSSTAAAACAEMLDERGDTEGADELYQRAVQGYPRDPEIQFEYGCFLYEKIKDATLAQVMYSKVLQTNPKHLGCLNNMGNIALMKNDTHTAEEMYRKAMEVAPGDMELVANYGLALHKRALQQHANVSKITYDYVKEQALASYMTAEEAMEQALKQNPNDTSVLCNLGFLKAQLRQADADAEKMFRRGLELAPGDASTMSNYALMVMSNGQLRKAEEMLIQALESDPKHASADCNLRFVRRLIDKQRIYQLTQKSNMAYPTSHGGGVPPGRPPYEAGGITVTPVPLGAQGGAAAAAFQTGHAPFRDMEIPPSAVPVAVYGQHAQGVPVQGQVQARGAAPVVATTVGAVVAAASQARQAAPLPHAAAAAAAAAQPRPTEGGVNGTGVASAGAAAIIDEKIIAAAMIDEKEQAWLVAAEMDEKSKELAMRDAMQRDPDARPVRVGSSKTTTEVGREQGKLWSVKSEIERIALKRGVDASEVVRTAVEKGGGKGVDGLLFPETRDDTAKPPT